MLAYGGAELDAGLLSFPSPKTHRMKSSLPVQAFKNPHYLASLPVILISHMNHLLQLAFLTPHDLLLSLPFLSTH